MRVTVQRFFHHIVTMLISSHRTIAHSALATVLLSSFVLTGEAQVPTNSSAPAPTDSSQGIPSIRRKGT